MNSITQQNQPIQDHKYICRQFIHDIQAPVAALQTILHCLETCPEDLKICYQMATDRIVEMLHDFKNTTLTNSHHDICESVNLLPVLNQIIAEKKISGKCSQNTNIVLNFNPCTSSNISINAHLTSFKRLLSNLLNNSIEAIVNEDGLITITVLSTNNMVEIQISDNGKGIPEKIIHRITECDFTYDKVNGSGLGLYHAKKCIESWEGSLSINSKENVGTNVTIRLKQASTTHAQSQT